MSRDLDGIYRDLSLLPGSSWGFVVYRCTYGDDEAWQRFMTHLNKCVRHNLSFYDGQDLVESLDWSVQEDPALDEASVTEVRDRFRSWIASNGHTRGAPGGLCCVMVNKECLDSVLNGPPPENPDFNADAYVYIIDRLYEKEEPDDELEDYEPIDGDTGYDVGWMKFCLAKLCPRFYTLIEGIGWEAIYDRPPAVTRGL